MRPYKFNGHLHLQWGQRPLSPDAKKGDEPAEKGDEHAKIEHQDAKIEHQDAKKENEQAKKGEEHAKKENEGPVTPAGEGPNPGPPCWLTENGPYQPGLVGRKLSYGYFFIFMLACKCRLETL